MRWWLAVVVIGGCGDDRTPPPVVDPPTAPQPAASPPPARPQPTYGFDAATCPAGEKGFQGLALGSHSLEVIGPDGDNCVFLYYREVEGGYETDRCVVKRTAGRVAPGSRGGVADPPTGSCTVVKKGNLFDDWRKH